MDNKLPGDFTQWSSETIAKFLATRKSEPDIDSFVTSVIKLVEEFKENTGKLFCHNTCFGETSPCTNRTG